MRTLESLERQEAKLRLRHTELFKANKWVQMQTVGRKLLEVLNQMHELKKEAPAASRG